MSIDNSANGAPTVEGAAADTAAAGPAVSAKPRSSIPFVIAAFVLAVVPLALLAVPFSGAGLLAAAVIAAGVVLGAIGVARASNAARGRVLAVVALALAVTTGTVSAAVGAGTTLTAGVETLQAATAEAQGGFLDEVGGGDGAASAEPAQISGQWVVEELLRLCDASRLHAVPSTDEPTLFLVGDRPVSAESFDFTVTVVPGAEAWSGELRGEVPAGVSERADDEVNPLDCADIEVDPVTGEVIAGDGSDAGEGSDAGGSADAPPAPEGEVNFWDIEVGMCLNDANLPSSFTSIPLVDCAQPHDSEVYAVESLPEGPYPGDDEVFRLADEICLDAFEPYVGTPYDRSLYFYGYYWPDKNNWGFGDREIVCVLFDENGQIEGSVRGSGR